LRPPRLGLIAQQGEFQGEISSSPHGGDGGIHPGRISFEGFFGFRGEDLQGGSGYAGEA
jgi:hypothetical protein